MIVTAKDKVNSDENPKTTAKTGRDEKSCKPGKSSEVIDSRVRSSRKWMNEGVGLRGTTCSSSVRVRHRPCACYVPLSSSVLLILTRTVLWIYKSQFQGLTTKVSWSINLYIYETVFIFIYCKSVSIKLQINECLTLITDIQKMDNF